MALKKKYLKTKPLCKVSFSLPKEVTNGVDTVQLVGDFNDWDRSATPMKRSKAGEYSVTIDLEAGRDYQYRYLLGESDWRNDPAADRYEYNAFAGSENSVVSV
ncbi:isoamylase early set domain-containing protein [Desulfocurvibacter africanus]|uniref:1,4-alpha-glucan branching enzyme n=1 Tax=Desulfocurvibacter africanus PCS TaxID=1262666 RepID=M5PRF5_DESAF|nr:isoamylase early set domain-containing protein [Desulfocurvibacter africanus]EMG36962.1 1,4-alpha-glucan branching enzyme [Desulfocurvibacter africanus PCS]